MTTIVLADDHQILRQGLRKLLEDEAGFHVIGEASDGIEATELVESLRPDILIVDMVMPGLSGLDVIRSVRKHSSNTRIIVLSMHADEPYVIAALRYGASGYLLKASSSTELIQAVQEVVAGNQYLSPAFTEGVLDAFVEKIGKPVTDPYDVLTERERQVLHLAAEGNSNAEIAERLSLGVRTIETHRANLQQKLGLKNQYDLIRYAMQRGLIK